MGRSQLKHAPADDDFLSERGRAEDILLGSLGFGEEAHIISIQITADGYRGQGKWLDGEEFEFECTDEIDEIQQWALTIFAPGNEPPTKKVA